MKNRDFVFLFIQGLSFVLKSSQGYVPLMIQPVIPFETLKNFIKRKHLAYEITPKSSDDANSLEAQGRYFHQSLSRTRNQTDPAKKIPAV